jgi:hypothetical protein
VLVLVLALVPVLVLLLVRVLVLAHFTDTPRHMVHLTNTAKCNVETYACLRKHIQTQHYWFTRTRRVHFFLFLLFFLF